jgi:hypothetical protein
MNQCGVENQQLAIDYPYPIVIECYKEIVKRRPVWKEENKGPNLFFLTPKLR